MKRLLLTALLLLGCRSSKQSTEDSATVASTPTKPAPSASAVAEAEAVLSIAVPEVHAGEKRVEISQSVTEVDTANGHSTSKRDLRYQVSILEVEGGKVKKVRLFYERYDQGASLDGRDVPRASPLSGHTYVLTRKPEGYDMTYEDGREIPKLERVALDARVEGEEDPFGLASDERHMTREPLVVGKSYPELAKVLANDILHEMGSSKPTKDDHADGSAVLASVTPGGPGHIATFMLKFRASSPSVTLELDQTLGVGVEDGRILTVKTTGEISQPEWHAKGRGKHTHTGTTIFGP